MRKAIIVDIDDCILEYSSRLREYVNEKYGKSIIGLSTEWDVNEWLRLGEVDSLSMINQFGDSWCFGTLDPMPGAVKVLNEFARKGVAIFGVTACGDSDLRKKLRMANIYNVFGPIFEEISFVPLVGDKTQSVHNICKSYDVIAFVDDRMKNLDIVDNSGIIQILFKQPHNKKHRDLVDFDAFCWHSIKQFLKDRI